MHARGYWSINQSRSKWKVWDAWFWIQSSLPSEGTGVSTLLRTIWPGQRGSLRKPRCATWLRDMPASQPYLHKSWNSRYCAPDRSFTINQPNTGALEHRVSKNPRPVLLSITSMCFTRGVHAGRAQQSTPCSSLPLNYHMPWLNIQLRQLLAEKTGKGWCHSSHEPSDEEHGDTAVLEIPERHHPSS